MPISKDMAARYPANWDEIALAVKERDGWKCLGCNADNGVCHPVFGFVVALAAAHLNHTPEDVRDENLVSLCQACHLDHDRSHHLNQRVANRRRAANTIDFFEGPIVAQERE